MDISNVYPEETVIAYQPNAGQTFLPAERSPRLAPVNFTPAPDPAEPLPITLTMKPEFEAMGFVAKTIGRQEFLPGVTAKMLDWFWANMEKCYYLWAPGEHKSFRWLKAPGACGFLNSAHEIVEPVGDLPVMMRIQITRLDPAKWYPFTECLDHVICEGIYNDAGELNDATIHLWQDVEGGCIHITCAVENKKISKLPDCIQRLAADVEAFIAEAAKHPAPAENAPAEKPIPHAEYESGMWPRFLPTMYGLWEDHPDPDQNIACDLTVRQAEDGTFHYVSCR